MTNPLDPSSRGTKRRNSEKVKEDMLTAAANLVHEHGLTVSLQHISLDSIAFGAGIPRSAVYRAWDTREDFFNELLLKLAGEPQSSPMAFDGKTLDEALATLKKELENDPDVLSTPDGRRIVLIEICRHGATVNYQNVVDHKGWRTYVALAATALSYSEPMKSKLQMAITQAQGSYNTGMAEFYQAASEILGRRLLPEFRSEPGRHPYAYLASTGAAAMDGLMLRNANFPKGQDTGLAPDLDIPARKADPFGTGRKEDWSPAAMTFTATFLAMTAPDEQYVYNRGDIDDQIQKLEQMAQILKAKATAPTESS